MLTRVRGEGRLNRMELNGYRTVMDWLDGFEPEVALVLGSGLGFFVEHSIEDARYLDYGEIAGFPRSTVAGHAGRFVAGIVEGVRVICMQGRFHYYEGYPLDVVTMPIRLFAHLGVRFLVLTNAAGGIHLDFSPGDLMLIEDHLNFLGSNPLRGPNEDELGARFPDMSLAYDMEGRNVAKAVAQECGIELKQGVYLATQGPSFETPAEIRAFARWGADAVGMSTVPECIVARHAGIRVLGISCITNLAAGLGNGLLSHDEVGETARGVEKPFGQLISGIIKGLSAL